MTSQSNAWYGKLLSPGVLLVFVTAVSLLLANSRLGEIYLSFWHLETGFSIGPVDLHKSILHWVNDGLMAIFFLLVGLEIKRELVEGELSTTRKAMLPILAALGGMAIPALIYVGFNLHTPEIHGWGIPMATDIAFALAVLSMLGTSVPGSIRIFLTALAIIDDLGAVLVIAFFYTDQLLPEYLGAAGVVATILFLLNKFKIQRWLPYVLCGFLLWYFILKSGVHATIAGVVLALFIPVNKDNSESMLHYLEHALKPYVDYFILPVFAIANTALVINGSLVSQLFSPAALGILIGLLLGKPIGITLFTSIAVRMKAAELPRMISMRHIVGAGLLGGIGFTMSIFIAMLAFDNVATQDLAKLSILITSMIAGISGYVWLKKTGRKLKVQESL